MSSTGAMTLPASEAPQQPPRRRTRKITVGSVFTTLAPGNLQAIADALKPAYEEALKDKHPDPVDAMIRVHTKQTSAALLSDQDLAPLVKKGGLSVVSAYYSLATGRVAALTGAPSA